MCVVVFVCDCGGCVLCLWEVEIDECDGCVFVYECVCDCGVDVVVCVCYYCDFVCEVVYYVVLLCVVCKLIWNVCVFVVVVLVDWFG